MRAQLPRTANFGVAGSRVLSQLGIFREYVEPLEPSVVVWFVNVNFAEPRQESEEPILMRYLHEASFSQGLRQRQGDVDSFVREVMVPLHLQRDRALREELGTASAFPFDHMMKLAEIRGVVDLDVAARRAPEKPNLSDFELAVDRVAETARGWGGRVLVVILPSYEISVGRPEDVERYRAVSDALRESAVTVVDGAALFAAEPDYLPLYTLHIDNHPSERGHALLAEAVVAAINSREKS
ncbi:MAG TPA: SGNH/GDSL hydrolase family protein [Gammaproteobacteria bacterium]|nr:SGNH/GDSL hydrolase family protein [Gammaproteobacteria bacterium]